MTANPLVSIIVPVLRDTPALKRLLETLEVQIPVSTQHVNEAFEIVVVNGDRTDGSLSVLQARFPYVQWTNAARGRATQMNAGADLATGRWLLFLHADTTPEPGWLEEFSRFDIGEAVGGAFKFKFESTAKTARLFEKGVDLRVRLLGLPYGDQGLFVKRSVFEAVGGYSLLPIMEDVDLVRRLWRFGPLVWSPISVLVSARRWEQDGWILRSGLNMALVSLFLVGISPNWLARRYYGRHPKLLTETGMTVIADPWANKPVSVTDCGNIVVIIPALNEERAIGEVLLEIPRYVSSITVVDNGSTDRTAEIAEARGGRVLTELKKGYGRACSTGVRANPDADIVVFLDADRSDYPEEMDAILAPIISGSADFVIGWRQGVSRPIFARLGTALCVFLINKLWGSQYKDLGPFRAIRKTALDQLSMVDQTWGWTIEMQVKAAETNLQTVEVPIRQRVRLGHSKISGTVTGTLRAGSRMLFTIWSLWHTRSLRSTNRQDDR